MSAVQRLCQLQARKPVCCCANVRPWSEYLHMSGFIFTLFFFFKPLLVLNSQSQLGQKHPKEAVLESCIILNLIHPSFSTVQYGNTTNWCWWQSKNVLEL